MVERKIYPIGGVSPVRLPDGRIRLPDGRAVRPRKLPPGTLETWLRSGRIGTGKPFTPTLTRGECLPRLERVREGPEAARRSEPRPIPRSPQDRQERMEEARRSLQKAIGDLYALAWAEASGADARFRAMVGGPPREELTRAGAGRGGSSGGRPRIPGP